MSRLTTDTFVRQAKGQGVNVIAQFRPSGTHAWPYWQFEMTNAWPHIADSLGLSKDDRGATCNTGGAIDARIKDFPDLGSCISGEYDGPNGGKIQDFRGGRAYWSPKTNAHFLWGRIGARYAEMGGPESALGYPVSEEFSISNGRGRFVNFENGAIYWNPDVGAVAVMNDMRDAWGKTKWEEGPLGYPIEPEKKSGTGAIQRFENGVTVRNSKGETQYVQGMIGAKYLDLGGLESKLGAPTSGETSIGAGRLSTFEHGKIYWSHETGAHVIYDGAIFDAWGKEGYENGRFGYPVKDQEAIPSGGQSVTFQHGEIREINGRIETR